MEKTIRELEEAEEHAAEMMMQARQARKTLERARNMIDDEVKKMGNMDGKSSVIADTTHAVQIPFAAYETQLERFQEEKRELLDRHEREKAEMRKHHRKVVTTITAALIALIIGMFVTVFWFVNNYEFGLILQDSTYGNANYIGRNGDIINGTPDNSLR